MPESPDQSRGNTRRPTSGQDADRRGPARGKFGASLKPRHNWPDAPLRQPHTQGKGAGGSSEAGQFFFESVRIMLASAGELWYHICGLVSLRQATRPRLHPSLQLEAVLCITPTCCGLGAAGSRAIYSPSKAARSFPPPAADPFDPSARRRRTRAKQAQDFRPPRRIGVYPPWRDLRFSRTPSPPRPSSIATVGSGTT